MPNRPAPIPLEAPGIEAPRFYANNDEAIALLDVLRGAGSLGATVAAAARQKQVMDEDAKVFDRGLAAADADRWLPGIRAKIESGGIIPDGDPDQFEGVAAGLVDTELGRSDLSAAYREEFSRRAVPFITERLHAARARHDEETDAARLQATQDSARGLKTASEIQTVIDEATSKFHRPPSDLRQRVGVYAMEYAAAAGDAEALDAAAKVLGTNEAVAQARLRSVLTGTVRAQVREREDAAEGDVFRLFNENAPDGVILSTIETKRADGSLTQERAAGLRALFLDRAQGRTVATIRTRILAGTIQPAEVHAETVKASKLSPLDPEYIDPNIGLELVAESKTRARVDLAKSQVGFVLSGGLGNLTEAQHGQAFTELVGPEGSGLLDQANRVAKPDELGQAIIGGRLMPRAIAQTLVSGVTSTDAGEIGRAGRVIGMIGATSPRLYAELLDAAGDSARPILDAAVDAFTRGQPLTGPAVERIREAIAARPEVPRPSPEVLDDLRRDLPAGQDVEVRWEDLIERTRQELPHTKDTLLGLDVLNADPALGLADAGIARRVQGWYSQRFAELRTRLPRAQAIAKAEEYTVAKLRSVVDFVRWNGTVTPVAIDRGEGLRLPEAMRWGDGFEAEARADLTAAGFDPDDVVSMRPFLEPATRPGEDPEAAMGWAYITSDGDAIRDDAGQLVVFRPTDRTAKRNSDFRALLDRKSQAFGGVVRRLFGDGRPSDPFEMIKPLGSGTSRGLERFGVELAPPAKDQR